MKPVPFEKTPEFQHFTDVMRKLVAVPKTEMDEQIEVQHCKGMKDKRTNKKTVTTPKN